jgi:4a-hydroxytetrahydrobiopterin dehydratase
MPRLTSPEIERQLATLPDWTLDGDTITKRFTFGSFPEAIAFLVRLAFEAEAVDHHPDITINYKRVTLAYSTHSEGGLTEKDFNGARAAERLVSR